MSDVSRVIKERIIAEFMGGSGSLDDDTFLFEEEIIDSLSIFLLMGFIKDRFGVDFEPEDVTIENFSTVRAIAKLVERKQAA